MLASGLGGTAQAQTGAAAAPRRSETRHSIRIGAHNVRYRAIVAETLLTARDGRPAALGVTTSYVADARSRSRPVLFAFNGGPGASSTPLHFGALGPRRMLRIPGQPERLIDNAFSPLDAVDLVFIDPVGTGYTRVLDDADGSAYWDVMGDAQAVTEIIQDWLAVSGRERSPKFLLGESYGGTRAAAMLKLGGVKFDGVMMFVGSLWGLFSPEGDDLPYVLSLPSLAAVAAFHGKTDARGRSPGQIYEDAYQYAVSDYAVALLQGSQLDAARRDAVAAQLSSLTGLSAAEIAAQNLRVDADYYVLNLLKDRNLRIGKLDGRATGALDAPAARPPYDDPSMQGRTAPGGDSYEDYFARELNFFNPTEYNALNLDINARWTFFGPREPAPNYGAWVGDAMRADPALRLYAGAGYYDLAVPVAGVRYALAHGGVPFERVALRYYDTGHTLFDTDANRQRVSDDLRAFVRGELP